MTAADAAVYDGPYPRLAAIIDRAVRPNPLHSIGVRFFFWGGPFALAVLLQKFSFRVWIIMHMVLTVGLNLSHHRYYSHGSFRTTRAFALVLAIWGWLGGERSPLFWAGTHRKHHFYCETPQDPHSPTKGFAYSHYLWLVDPSVRRIHWGWLPPELMNRLELYILELLATLSFVVTPMLAATVRVRERASSNIAGPPCH